MKQRRIPRLHAVKTRAQADGRRCLGAARRPRGACCEIPCPRGRVLCSSVVVLSSLGGCCVVVACPHSCALLCIAMRLSGRLWQAGSAKAGFRFEPPAAEGKSVTITTNKKYHQSLFAMADILLFSCRFARLFFFVRRRTRPTAAGKAAQLNPLDVLKNRVYVDRRHIGVAPAKGHYSDQQSVQKNHL